VTRFPSVWNTTWICSRHRLVCQDVAPQRPAGGAVEHEVPVGLEGEGVAPVAGTDVASAQGPVPGPGRSAGDPAAVLVGELVEGGGGEAVGSAVPAGLELEEGAAVGDPEAFEVGGDESGGGGVTVLADDGVGVGGQVRAAGLGVAGDVDVGVEGDACSGAAPSDHWPTGQPRPSSRSGHPAQSPQRRATPRSRGRVPRTRPATRTPGACRPRSG
jgi:hypothetical protein